MERLFVCIWIPKNLKKGIIDLQKEMKGFGVIGNFVDEENIHVTVTFLGNMSREDVKWVKMCLDKFKGRIKKFHVELHGLKCIPNENFTRIIGVNVKSDVLDNTIKIIGEEIGGKYHKRSKITLCRVKRIKDKTRLKRFIEKNRNIDLGELHVKKLSLVKSTLTKNGPLYETIENFELGKNE